MALAFGRIAYAVEAGTPSSPGASTVIVSLLQEHRLVRSDRVAAQVYGLALSDIAVGWSESSNAALGARASDWRVLEAGLPAAEPAVVPTGIDPVAHPFPAALILDGRTVVASSDDFSGSGATVRTISGTDVEIIVPAVPNRACAPVAARDGAVILRCVGSIDQQYYAGWIASWSRPGGLRAFGLDHPLQPLEVQVHDGWLFWTGYNAALRLELVAARMGVF
jgi:hypothetical protein